MDEQENETNGKMGNIFMRFVLIHCFLNFFYQYFSPIIGTTALNAEMKEYGLLILSCVTFYFQS